MLRSHPRPDKRVSLFAVDTSVPRRGKKLRLERIVWTMARKA